MQMNSLINESRYYLRSDSLIREYLLNEALLYHVRVLGFYLLVSYHVKGPMITFFCNSKTATNKARHIYDVIYFYMVENLYTC